MQLDLAAVGPEVVLPRRIGIDDGKLARELGRRGDALELFLAPLFARVAVIDALGIAPAVRCAICRSVPINGPRSDPQSIGDRGVGNFRLQLFDALDESLPLLDHYLELVESKTADEVVDVVEATPCDARVGKPGLSGPRFFAGRPPWSSSPASRFSAIAPPRRRVDHFRTRTASPSSAPSFAAVA
jgi:hypothetical protein